MIGKWTVGRAGALALLIASTAMSVGCSDDLKAENNALRVQNKELQAEYNASRQALTAAELALSEKDTRIADLEAQLATQPVAVQPVTVATPGTGFEGIEGVDVSRGSRGEVTVRVPGDVLFASGKTDLKTASKQTLAQVASVLKTTYAGNIIRVEGYTDTDPIRKSGHKDNLELSTKRANAVVRYLASQGVSMDTMYSAGMHERNQQGSKAKSRRVEIVVVK